ncbi:MAG TPA: hypothetical protein VGC42_20660 [Kofleriaceae bacterium]
MSGALAADWPPPASPAPPAPAPASPPPTRPEPLLEPAQAASLLDLVIYERVLECIDLDALARVEHALMSTVAELAGVSPHQASYTAKSMVDRALLRFPSHARAYLRVVDALRCTDCGHDRCACDADA